MNHSTPKKIVLYAGAGLASAVMCWAGGRVLPESLFLKVYPGIILGVTLLALGHVLGEIPRPRYWIAALLLPAFSALGWRLAVDVGYEYGGPVPYVTAGAMGAFFVAIGLLLAWRIRSRAVLLVCIVTAAGALGGAVFQLIHKAVGGIGEDYWVLILFAEWQVLLMLGLALAMARVRPAPQESIGSP